MCKLNRPRNECLWALRAVLAGGVGRIPSVACRARGPVAGKAGPCSGAPGAFHLPVHQHPPHLLTDTAFELHRGQTRAACQGLGGGPQGQSVTK